MMQERSRTELMNVQFSHCHWASPESLKDIGVILMIPAEGNVTTKFSHTTYK